VPTPTAPVPPQPSKPSQVEVPTAKAELQIVLLPTAKETPQRKSKLTVPAGQVKRPVDMRGRGHLALTALFRPLSRRR
jgi:hypothetical protein